MIIKFELNFWNFRNSYLIWVQVWCALLESNRFLLFLVLEFAIMSLDLLVRYLEPLYFLLLDRVHDLGSSTELSDFFFKSIFSLLIGIVRILNALVWLGYNWFGYLVQLLSFLQWWIQMLWFMYWNTSNITLNCGSNFKCSSALVWESTSSFELA